MSREAVVQYTLVERRMTITVTSRDGVPIRLTDERWAHIVEQHAELAGMRQDVLEALANAERVLAGQAGERLAIQAHAPGQFLVVVYREIDSSDGFILTAFLTKRTAWMERRHSIWPPKS